MSVGSFMLIKNERPWIEAHLANLAPHLDEIVFFDGNSTDGTLDVLRDYARRYPSIRVFEGKDPEDLRGAYEAMFDECLKSLRTDLAVFLHPDMWVDNPAKLRSLNPAIAGSMRVISYAGDPDGQLWCIEEGRTDAWKNIYRLRSPDLGAHYHGWYGAWNEDVYFSEITGAEHFLHKRLADFPYPVEDSGVVVHHFSDVRPYGRRLARMLTCLVNQGRSAEDAERIAKAHPRVTLKDGDGFTFKPAEYPEGMRGMVKWGVHA